MRRLTMTKEKENMKIVVIGGTGLIGSKLVTKLREYGHGAVSASPNSGARIRLCVGGLNNHAVKGGN
jgi:nucleoside-diphosphate-sugar epimerase